jgi:TPP-dependent pyruvate/acetoin dehydrogenase alpha subunit
VARRAREAEALESPGVAEPDHPLGPDLYRTMRLIRATELEIEKMHHEGVMMGSFHSSMGQESSAAGVCSALRPEDLVTSTHRGHGHAIAKGVPIAAIFGELLGRAGGTSGGRGGSMHLHHRDSGFLGENAIVGGGLPWAAGAAWARRRLGRADIGVAFTGDGGAAQGIFHETLRLAQFFKAPCLFVCENNGLAHSMPSDELFGVPGTITKMVAATGMLARFIDGRDAIAVHHAADELVGEVRQGCPAFLEVAVFRVRAHSLSDAEYRYRAKDSGSQWLERNDPITRLRKRLGPDSQPKLDEIDEEVRRLVSEARAAAEAMELASVDSALRGVYATPQLGADGPA